MNSIIKAFDRLPLLVKVIFALPVLDILWGFYRLCRSIHHKNVLGIVLGILMLVLCPTILWILDIITILLSGRVLWID